MDSRRAGQDNSRSAIRETAEMSARPFNVLFICTGNSARSVLAEALLNGLGRGRFRAYSAGSHPAGKVNPLALELIEKNGLPAQGLRSKSWDEFTQPGAPHMDFVFTVCDQAAGEACPAWPGRQMHAHWGIDDPAAVQGSDAERRKAFLDAFNALQSRLLIFASLPLDKLEPPVLQRRLDELGKLSAADEAPTNLSDRIQSASRATRTVRSRPAGRI
jgi:arsenate reductase